MQRVGVIADAHANLPATRAALGSLEAASCEAIVHVGDAVGIGPYPREVVALLTQHGVHCLMGNHDEWSALGLPDPPPRWMSDGEAAHQHWTRGQLSAGQRETMKTWPYALELACGQVAVAFVHYARRASGGFDHLANPSARDFERLFRDLPGDVVVFGHDHQAHDLASGGRRFLSPGSVGCHDAAEARAMILTAVGPTLEATTLAVPYDDSDLMRAFEDRQVPEREFILRTFIRR